MNASIALSIIIPCRNEKKYIGHCLESIIVSNFPKDQLEVFVVDGMSNDGTRDIVNSYVQAQPFIGLLDNERRITPIGMNIGIKQSRGRFIMILSSHSEIEPHFIKNNVEALQNHEVDCVGGILVTMPGGASLTAQAISIALSEPFGVGNSYFRTGVKESRYVDTVPFGCYRREVFHRIGLFDEDLVRNQDDELNLRLLKSGGKILLEPGIVSHYYARDRLYKLFRMFYQYGFFKPLVARKLGSVLTVRQIIPACFVGCMILSFLLTPLSVIFLWLLVGVFTSYLIASITSSLYASRKHGIKYLPVLPIVFATLHFSYGLGYLRGILDFIILRRHRRKTMEDMPLTR